MRRRVVITGLGAASAIGSGVQAVWGGLLDGRSGLGPAKGLDASGFACKLAGEVGDLAVRDHVPKSYRKATKVMARDSQLAVAATQFAVSDAALATRGSGEVGVNPTPEDSPRVDGPRLGCQIGAGLLAADTAELSEALATAVDDEGRFSLRLWGSAEGGGSGMNNLPPLWMLKYLPNMLACHVTIIHGAQGPSNTITCAEASGLLSLGESARVIERGDADVCFSGGAESKINPMGLQRLWLTGLLAETGEEVDGSRVVRPYDPVAPGGVPGEGAAILIVEEAGLAAERGARVYAEVAGFGASHSPAPLFPGVLDGAPGDDGFVDLGVERAVRAALRDAGIEPGSIDAIVPAGVGARMRDLGEANALRAVFGARLGEIEVVTLTPQMGLMSAGHGAMQAAVGALCLREQRLPARLHAGLVPGETFGDLRVGPAGAREATLNHVLVCCASTGGQAAAAVLRRVG